MLRGKYVAIVTMDFCYSPEDGSLEDVRNTMRDKMDDMVKSCLQGTGITVTVSPMLKDVWQVPEEADP